MLILSRARGFKNRVLTSRHGILAGGLWVPKHKNVLAVLYSPDGKVLIPAGNIVTDAGDLYYAQLGASEATTNAFGVHVMCTAGTPGKAADYSSFTPIAASEKAHASTYPKTNDADADNTGAGTDIVTYLASYAKADFTGTGITHGVITNATPGASEPLLTGYAFAASFDKTSNDTLKVFVNHQMNGV